MMRKVCAWTFLLFVIVVGLVSASENYIDYGNEGYDKESLRDLFKHLKPKFVHRNSQDAGSFRAFSGDDFHPMSDPQIDNPSIRLRFGRSDPKFNAVNLLSKLKSGSRGLYEENE